jgi:CRP-like cAMP-binding protein
LIAGIAPDRTHDLARGQILFRQGDAATAIYRVIGGCLRLERRTFDGRLVVLHTARPGELFAEASLFADAYHCDAVATEPAQVEVYRKAEVLAALGEAACGADGLLATMARQLHAVRARLELRNIRSARERVLLWLDLKAGRDRIVTLDGPLQDIAAELGLTREALYRALAGLEADAVIARDAGRISLRRASTI